MAAALLLLLLSVWCLVDGAENLVSITFHDQSLEASLCSASYPFRKQGGEAYECGMNCRGRPLHNLEHKALNLASHSPMMLPYFMVVVNDLSTAVEAWWKAYDRSETSYGIVTAGRVLELETYIGHVWIFRAVEREACGAVQAIWDGVPAGYHEVVRLSRVSAPVDEISCWPVKD